ncbi:MAG: phosphoenolpyruvate--protein phosphotransferase [Candidatus Dormibacteraeota bacterium]|nr:phosphoenolpyruvate--protein phosphotransferase [Candidatus Dormibacteraeota bacterium]
MANSPTQLRGIPAAPGQVSAPAWRWEVARGVANIDLAGARGIEHLHAAIEHVRAALATKTTRLIAAGAVAESAILEAQALMLDDPALIDGATALVQEGRAADAAVAEALAPFASMLRASPDPVFQARAADVDDVVEQIRRALHGVRDSPPPPTVPSIVVAKDLAPSQTAGLDRALVVGFATEQGTATAHTAILARALGLPAVVGIAGLVDSVRDGVPLLLDGDAGIVVVDPPADAVAHVTRVAQPLADALPAATRDGHRIEVGCNAATAEDAKRAAAAGADGIGLLRSEFLFMEGDHLPTEDEQVATLEQVMRAMGGRSVILRTLDVGADKPLPALPQPAEANPALGVRGLRLHLLRRPDLLAAQLRAAIRVAATHPLRVMFPMVSTVEEVRQARQLLQEAADALSRAGHPPVSLQVGIMIEVPAAAILADRLVGEVDFFSLGTNDLTQYLFAADRTNPELAGLSDSLHPAVLRLIDQVVRAAHARDRWVGVCGEMASDLTAVPLLVGLGVDELSVHPPLVARVKAVVRRLDYHEAAAAARTALGAESGAAVRHLLSTT